MVLSRQPKGYAPKKLVAREADDLRIFSALTQDAALTPRDMAFDKKARRFVLTVNRYIHEERGWFRRDQGWRQRTALHFDHVIRVRQQGFDAGADALALLSISCETPPVGGEAGLENTAEPADAGETGQAGTGQTVRLTFANAITLELYVDSIDAYLTDMGDPWEALARPDHDT